MSVASNSTTTTSETATTAVTKPTAVIDFGVHEDRNKTKRRKMEDASAAIDAFNGEPTTAFFGVYDGHSGADAAKFCASNLHLVYANTILI